MLTKQQCKQIIARLRYLLKRVEIAHNVCLLVLHLATLYMIGSGFYLHMYTGLKFHPSRLSSLDLWPRAARAAKSTIQQAALALFYVAEGSAFSPEDRKRVSKNFVGVLHFHLKALLLCFVTLDLLRRRPRPRWTLVYLSTLTVLGILDIVNRFNLFAAQKNEFVEWLEGRCKRALSSAFLFLYPLLTLSEVVLAVSSQQHLRSCSAYRAFPSPMPNKFNFSINLHTLYKLVPVPLAVSSALVYIKRWRSM